MPTFRRTNEWKKWLDKEIKASLKLDSEILEDTAKEFKNRVQKKTPTGDPSLWHYKAPPGYKPGTLKASWEMDMEYTGGVIKAAFVYNPQPYAAAVEQGWSTQTPPGGMMRTTILEVPEIIAQIARRKR